MLYTTMTVNNKEYKLRLNTKSCVELEKKLNGNPITVLQKVMATDEIPEIGLLMNILHASLTAYNHGITLEQTYEIYDRFVDDGNTLEELMPIILDVFEVSGFFKKQEDEEGKN